MNILVKNKNLFLVETNADKGLGRVVNTLDNNSTPEQHIIALMGRFPIPEIDEQITGQDLQSVQVAIEHKDKALKAQAINKELAELFAPGKISKQEAPGPPPRPGLQWKPQTHRWIRPQGDVKEEWAQKPRIRSDTFEELDNELRQVEDYLGDLRVDLERDPFDEDLQKRQEKAKAREKILLAHWYHAKENPKYFDEIAQLIADEDDHWNELYAETVTPEEQALIAITPLGVNTLTGGINTTFMLTTEEGGQVFKPKKGEEEGVRQDIPGGSYYIREIAAYRFAELLGLSHLVPVTGYREFKENKGSSQQFIEEAEGLTSSEFEEHESRYDAALFDALIGNTDRHQFNALKDSDGSIKLIDHGLAFPEGVEPSFPRSVFVKAVEGQHLQDHHREMLTWVTDNADEIEHNLTWMLRSKTAAKGVTARAKAMLDTDSYTGPYEWTN